MRVWLPSFFGFLDGRSLRRFSATAALSFVNIKSAFASPNPSDDNAALYRVEQVQGTVLVRGPFTPVWEELKVGDLLPEGDLLQTLPGSRVRLRHMSSKKKSRAASQGYLTLKIDTPLVVRVDQDIVRKVVITPNFFENLPSLEALHRNLEKETFSLKSAWSKVTATIGQSVSRLNSKKLDLARSAGGQGVESSIKAGKIDVLTPYNLQTLRVSNLPHDLVMRWKEVAGKNLSFNVYLWQTSGERPAPIGMTRRNQYTHTLPRPGKYYLQITSQDGGWQSEVVTFLVSHSSGMLANSGGLGRGSSTRKDLDLQYPPESFEIVARDSGRMEIFRWESTVQPNGHWLYEWVLTHADGRIVRRVKTSENLTLQEIPRGEYLWYVEGILDGEREERSQFGAADRTTKPSKHPAPPLKIKSALRSLKVIQTDQEERRRQIVSEFLKGRSHASLYLSEGL